MANAVRVVVNRAAVRELLRSPAVLADLEARARRISAAAGPGHEVQGFTGRNRVRATVRTDTFQAMENEAIHRTLTSAIDAGRG